MRRRTVLQGMLLLAGLGGRTWAAERPASIDAVLGQWERDEHADLRAVVVTRAAEIVVERYFNGATASELHDIRSAGKSITSLLVGAALDRGLIRSLSDSVARYWPEARASAVGDVSLRDVLTMRSGLAAFDERADSPGNEDRLDQAEDPVAFALGVPRADRPGTVYRYNSLTAYIAGLVVEKAARQRLADFARAVLFEPLGIPRWEWAVDAAGHTKGQGNLSVTARDLAKIGQLVLDGGAHQDRRVLSAEWIRESLEPRVSIRASDPFADGYGYFWYQKTHEIAGQQTSVSFASGNGGNKIYVVPARKLVVAITSSAYGRGYGQQRSAAILTAVLAKDRSQTSANTR